MFAVSIVVACGSFAQAFPSEEQLKSNLRKGLTPDELVGLFGEPNNGRLNPCVDCTFTYLPPLGSLSVEKEGYTGVSVRFTNGRVSSWRIYTGNPSYAEPKMPAVFRWWLWFFGITFGLGIVSKLLIRFTPVASVVAKDIGKAFEDRQMDTHKIPPEFGFITHETTLQQVIDKAGKPSRIVRVPISADRGLGYALVSSNAGAAEIVSYEYDLPYHAAVIVMPEFPFEPENRIRAVFYRPIQRELAEATD
jgi:hypothetical protein